MMNVACHTSNSVAAARAPLEALATAMLSNHHRVVVAKLAKAYPNPVRTWELVDALYGHDPDGGPEDGNQSLASMIVHVRARLAPYGWTIPPAKRGPKSDGYRLEEMR